MDRIVKLLKLAARTGDTLIVHDTDLHTDVVLLSVDKYEHLLDASPAQVNTHTPVQSVETKNILAEKPRVTNQSMHTQGAMRKLDDVNAALALAGQEIQDDEFAQENVFLSPTIHKNEHIDIPIEQYESNPVDGSISVLDSVDIENTIEERTDTSVGKIHTSWHSTKNILENRFSAEPRAQIDSNDILARRAHQIDLSHEPLDFDDDDQDEPIFYEEPV